MKQQQAAASTAGATSQKVDSPLAKYTANGDLVCILCKAPVKSSVAWNAHCASATHKANLETLLLKKKQQRAATPAATSVEQDEEEPSAKRAKFSESHEEQTHRSEPSMPDITPAGPVPPSEEPEITNEEILRQLRYDFRPPSI